MSSRIVVKGLPKYVDNDRLRQIFSEIGEVTDVRVVYTRDGKHRQFGFVGFKNESYCKKAMSLYNNTFLDTSRISVEIAKPFGDQSLPRPWSKYSEGSSRNVAEKRSINEEHEGNLDGGNNKKIKLDKNDENALFKEFVNVSKARNSRPLWQDDAVNEVTNGGIEKSLDGSRKGKLDGSKESDGESSSDEEYEDKVDSVSIGSEEMERKEDKFKTDEEFLIASKRKGELSDEEELGSNSESEEHEESSDDEESGEESSESSSSESDDESEVEKNGKVEANEEKEEDEEVDEDSGRLFIRNLPFSTTEDELEALFEPFGALAELHIVVDNFTRLSKGLAFVTFVLPSDANSARSALDGQIFQGRLLHILHARPKPPTREELEMKNDANQVAQKDHVATSSFKRQQEKQRDAAVKTRGGDSSRWGALMMNSDAVGDVIARRLGVSKQELYGVGRGESGSAAVRIAAGEAQLQSEARSALKAEGIDVDALFKARSGSMNATTVSRRSRRVMLVKNLGSNVTEHLLEQTFSKFGSLVKAVLVGGGLIGLVEFAHVNDAKSAYSGMAYRRLGGSSSPVYLEWAPILKEEQESGTIQKPIASKVDQKDEIFASHIAAKGAGVTRCSVYVKNLNFETDEHALRSLFSAKAEGVCAVTIARKKEKVGVEELHNGMKNNSVFNQQNNSMGYGFVEFENEQLAKDAIGTLQGIELHGHALQLKISSRHGTQNGQNGEQSGSHAANALRSTKLVVRNVAFEATANDIKALFTAFGQVKGVRLPRKMNGEHRGFAFVEFLSRQEAATAAEALKSAHLYGRHLIIEPASNETNAFTQLAS
uniref:RRM domain-containing protein n=1 Tax=Timspurckia oligopyrenoides TaxID=708627 RepID=A0A7S0ZHN6_9RHOD